MADDSFDTWLAKKLNSLGLDEEVYLDYIKSILDEGENESEIKESLCDILSGLLVNEENDVVETAGEIIKVWENKKAVENVSVNGNSTDNNHNDDNIKKFIEQQQTKFATNTKKSKNVDYDLKNQLVAQYGEISDQEGEDESDDDSGPPSSFVNSNAQAVTDKIHQEREKSKKEFEEKKIRDKLNRDKEKSKREDRQDKEKKRTQKGERKAR